MNGQRTGPPGSAKPLGATNARGLSDSNGTDKTTSTKIVGFRPENPRVLVEQICAADTGEGLTPSPFSTPADATPEAYRVAVEFTRQDILRDRAAALHALHWRLFCNMRVDRADLRRLNAINDELKALDYAAARFADFLKERDR